MKRFIALLLICVMSFGILSVSAEEPVATEVAVESFAEETDVAEPAVEAEEESAEAAVLTAEEETEEEASEVTEPEVTEPAVTEPEVTEPEVTEPAAEVEEETTQPQEQEEETAAPEEEVLTEPAQEELITSEEQELSTEDPEALTEEEEETEGIPETEETAEETPEGTEPEETIEVLNTYEDGWNTDDNGNTIYVVNGEPIKDDWKKIDGYWYYFDWDGAMYSDRELSKYDYSTGTSTYYYFGSDGHMQTGWFRKNGDTTTWYHAKSNGVLSYGFETIDNYTYYFEWNGRMIADYTYSVYDSSTGTSKYYYFDKSGHMQTGWFRKDGDTTTWYHAKASGELSSGWEKISGYYYYFGYGGRMYCDETFGVDDNEYRVDKSGHMVTGWYEESGSKYYYKSSGAAVNGPYTVDGTRYYFNYGYLSTNTNTVYTSTDGTKYIIQTDGNGVIKTEVKLKENGWTKAGDERYYYEDGEPAYGWRTIGGYRYYFDWNGRMYHNETTSIYDSSTGTSKRYYFDDDGHLQTGWFRHADDTVNWYHAGEDGVLSEGLEKIGSYTYYFEWGGRMITNTRRGIYDSSTETNKYYYFDKSGHMQTGWYQKDGDDNWYHAKTNGELSSGWEKVSGYWYYFDTYNGRMYRDQVVYTEDGYYRVDEDGHMIKGWYDDGTDWYYYLSSGKAATGIVKIGTSNYYFSTIGTLQYNTTVVVNNVLYKIDGNGKVASSKKAADVNGWYKDGDNYYYSSDGTFVVGQLKKIGAKWYGFSNTGVMYSNTTASIDGNLYGFDGSGYMVTGWYENSNGYYYYFGSDGKAYQGLKTIGSKKYYFNPSMAVSSKWTENGNLYVADKAGYVTVYSGADGWVNDRYYVANGKLVKEGWKKIDGSWYYFENGEAKRDQTVTIDGKRYHFNTSKALDTGWIRGIYNTYWSYADANGALITDSWKKIGTKKYYFGSNAYALTGMSRLHDESGINYNLYLFNTDGSLKKQVTETEKWIKNDKDWFYVDSYGNYATGDREIDGKVYGFNYSNGALYTNQQGYTSGGIRMKSAWYEYQPGIYWYYDENGNTVTNEWKKIGGKWYYFNGSRMATGDLMIKGKLYHFSDSGVWDGKDGVSYKNGWNLINGYYYYYDSTNGLYKGLQTIQGNKYFFNYNGAMASNGIRTIHGTTYVFGENGAMLKNAWLNVSGNIWYYADANGKAVSGLQTIGGKKYYFGSTYENSNVLATYNMMTNDRKTYYAITDDGVIVNTYTASGTGWKKTNEGVWLYCEKGLFVSGYQQIGSDYYYFSNGAMLSDYYNPSYGYFGSDGKLQKEKKWIKAGDVWYYFTGGSMNSMNSMYGSRFIDGKWYYFSPYAPDQGIKYADGALYEYAGSAGGRTKLNWSDGWNTYNGKKYYVENGRPVNGLKKIGSRYYYFMDGEMATEGRLVSTGYGNLYLNADGSFVKNGWKKIDDVWCYFDGTGYMLTGTWIIDGKTYHLRHPNYYYGVG